MQLDAGRTHSWYEKLRLVRGEKDEADRAGDSFSDRNLREGAGFDVDAEDDDGIGILIFRKKEAAGGIDGEVARFFAAGGVIAGAFEFASRWIDGEHGDGIVAAIGGKEPFARRMRDDFGGVVAALEIRGKHRHYAKISEYAMIRGISKFGDGRIEFAKDVKIVSIG